MGIDVYLDWKGKTDEDTKAQYTGFSVVDGDKGYLREAYHGGPYATAYLMPEAWDEDWTVPAAKLRERLPATVFIALYRNHVVYEQGANPGHINLDGATDPVEAIVNAAARAMAEATNPWPDVDDIAKAMTEEQIKAVSAMIAERRLPDYALSFVDFVDLAERKERETGEPCTIVVSA